MAAVLTYTPSDVIVAISGYIVTGVVSVNITWNAETFKKVSGIRGQVTRVQNRDTSATMTIELLQTSSTNDVFTDLLIEDKSKQSSRLQVSVKDTSGRTEISSLDAFIASFPEVSFSDGFTNRVWTIHMLSTTTSVGGNGKQFPDIFNAAGEAVGEIVGNISSGVSSAIDSASSAIGNIF